VDSVRNEGDYAKPPIVEAVIERRFANPIDFTVVNDLRRKFEREYPAVAQTAEFSLAFNTDAVPPEVKQTPLGYRMIDHQGTDIVIATTQAVAFGRLAPYPGWKFFSAAASEVFEKTREVTGYVPLGRIGVRYINRLDLPLSEKDGLALGARTSDYILVRPEYPASLISFTHGFTLQCIFDVQVNDCTGTMTVATVPSPVPQHMSIVLDIDIWRDVNVPQNERDIQKLLDLIRVEKNRIFESSITDRMRELFA
jgi:uncharacterized protein (TIGR04255 family)